MSRRKRKWILVWVGVLGIVITAAELYWKSASDRFCERVTRHLQGIWKGSVVLEHARYSPFGPLRIGSISLYDSSGHLWIRADQVVLLLDDWAVLGSRLREIQVQYLRGSLVLDPDHSMPLDTQWLSSAGENLDCRIRVDDCSVDWIDPSGLRISYRDLAWNLNPVGDQLRFFLIQNPSDVSDFMYAEVLADLSNNNISGRIDLSHTATTGEIQWLQSVLRLPRPFVASGRLRTELEFAGTGPGLYDIRLDGQLSISDGKLWDTSGSFVLEGLQASAKFRDNWVSVDSASGRISGGTFSANLMGTWNQFGIDNVTGQLKIRDAQMSRCEPWLPKHFPLNRGTADLEYVFFGIPSSHPMEGYGRLRLSDADMMRLPVIPDLFSPLGLPPSQPIILSDGVLEFTHSGPELQISQARIFNSVAALIAESGGTIRLDNGNLDLFVIGVPIQVVEDLLSKIPLIRIFNRATNKLVRLHVLGNWSDSPDRLIRQEPLENLQESVRGLFEDLSRGGTNLAEKVRQAGRSLWKDLFEDDCQVPFPSPERP
ncbi:MAG: type II secretion system protein N [Phycisphaerae bacterium]|nr:type II secretion system protein N [Phycisphaerae bacterium]